VYIYYGKAAGEIDFANPSQVLYGPGDAAGGLFGASCAVMDYDGDGSNDLVVGSPSRAVGGLAGRGAVFIYKGAPSSPLPVSNSDILNPPAGTGTANMQFGYSLAIGDFDGNGKKDLAVGAIGTSTVVGAGIAGVPAATYTNAGRVFVYFANGSGAVQSVAPAVRTLLPPTGPTGTAASAGNYCGNPNLTNLPKPISNMNFGASLAAFPTRPKAAGILGTDLVVCAPGYTSVAQDFSGTSPATTGVGICYIYEGSVNVHGDGSSLAGEMSTCPTDDIRYWPAAAAGYPNNANFGSSMTVGVLPGSDNAPDLLICARQSRTNDVSQTQGAGSCYLYQQNADGSGNSAGGFDTYNPYHPNANARLTPLYVKAIDNPSGQIEGSIANQYSYFGQSVLVQDINNNGSSDLLVGEPWSDSRKAISGGNNPQATLGKDSGRVYILRGGFWP
jgi:hypothetical protein